MKKPRLILLISYFFLVQLFGFLSAHTSTFVHFKESSILFMFAGAPIFFLIYTINLFRISVELERDHPEIFDHFALNNPFRREKTVVLPSFFFRKPDLAFNHTLTNKINLTKWSLIFCFSSFLLMIVIQITGY